MQRDIQVRALEVCLQKLQAGEQLEKILEIYPQLTEWIEPRLEAAQALQLFSSRLIVPDSAQTYSRSLMVQEINQLASTSRRRSCSGWLGLVILVSLLAAFILVFLSASKSLPGDLLYPVKQVVRQVQVAITPDAARRLAMERSFDQQRLEEVRRLANEGQEQPVQFTAGLIDIPPGNWKFDQLEISVPPDAQLIGQIDTGMLVEITGTTLQNGTIEAAQLRPRLFIVTGTIDQSDDNSLTVAGVRFLIDDGTVKLSRNLPGAPVTVTAIMRLDGSLQARIIENAAP